MGIHSINNDSFGQVKSILALMVGYFQGRNDKIMESIPQVNYIQITNPYYREITKKVKDLRELILVTNEFEIISSENNFTKCYIGNNGFTKNTVYATICHSTGEIIIEGY